MNVFNSLGSNYSLRFALRCLFANGDQGATETLKQQLEDRYGGKATLYYKGRQALKAAAELLQLESKAVAINGFTCFAVYDAFKQAGVRPVMVDINRDQLHFDAVTLTAALASNPDLKAVVVQNTLGLPCEIESIEKFCRQHKLALIEDLAHSLGTTYADGREAGTVGDLVMLSFGRDKVVDAVSGGALIVRDQSLKLPAGPTNLPAFWPQWVDRWYPFHTWLVRAFYPVRLGILLRAAWRKLGLMPLAASGWLEASLALPPWQANLVLYQLDKLESVVTHRARIADIYLHNLASQFGIPSAARLANHSTNLRFPILAKNRPELLKRLKRIGVNIADIWYDTPISPARLMKSTTYRAGECKAAEAVGDLIINLPTHINVSESQADKLVAALNSYSKDNPNRPKL